MRSFFSGTAVALALMLSLGLEQSFAQTSTGLSICLTRATGQLRAATRCRVGEIVLSAQNFASSLNLAPATNTPTPTPGAGGNQASGGVNLGTCYSTQGQSSGGNFDGRVTVSVQCAKSSQVMIGHSFATTDSTDTALPTLQSQRLRLQGQVPNGVEITTLGASRKFYSLSVSAVCCDRQQ